MGAIEIVIIVAAAAIVTGVAISAIVAKKRGKGGCSGCAGCPYAGKCSGSGSGNGERTTYRTSPESGKGEAVAALSEKGVKESEQPKRSHKTVLPKGAIRN